MSRRKGNRGTRLVAAFAVLGVVVALAAGLRAASAATNDVNAQGKNGKVQHATNGPKAKDFINIKNVKPNVKEQKAGKNGSSGTFVSECGTNANRHLNPDNHIVAPGAANGAHHFHDYVGNKTTSGKSNDKSLAKGGTTCQNQADQSAYFWPVIRDITQNGNDVNKDGGGKDNNKGKVLQPSEAKIEFRGNAASKVVAMPNNLKVITGDAKAVTNGPKNANAKWTCTGFEDRTTVKYPLCPNGSQVERILDFPSCWDGKNTDSADHRSHIVFPQGNGACPKGFKAVPQLRYTLTYDVPQGQNFAVDTFPEENHVPLTDHADFDAVMSKQLLSDIANCVNSGQDCVNQGNGGANQGGKGKNAKNADNANADNANADDANADDPNADDPSPSASASSKSSKGNTKGGGKTTGGNNNSSGSGNSNR
jgi:Domain of unknown function (DUF1996)